MATKSILIVEDDITYGMMLKTWLGKKGFHVASASSIAGMRYVSARWKESDTKSTISCTVDGANTRIWKSPWPVALVACQ